MPLDLSQIAYIKKRQFTKKRKQESKRRAYTYISSKSKRLFLNLFLFQSYKIQDAADKAGIKYSSAKTILFMHRKEFKEGLIKDKLAALNCIKSCGFKVKENSATNNITIISRIGCH